MSNSAVLARARLPPTSRAVAFDVFFLVWFSSHVVLATGHPDYADALGKSLLFFQGQRSGRLPPDQAVRWRSDSATSDGSAANVSRHIVIALLLQLYWSACCMGFDFC
jgi:endoglucanase